VTELALFGSVLRDDFRPDSDIDIMVEFIQMLTPPFAPSTKWKPNSKPSLIEK